METTCCHAVPSSNAPCTRTIVGLTVLGGSVLCAADAPMTAAATRPRQAMRRPVRRFMCDLLERHETRRASVDQSDEGIDDTFVSTRRLRIANLHACPTGCPRR